MKFWGKGSSVLLVGALISWGVFGCQVWWSSKSSSRIVENTDERQLSTFFEFLSNFPVPLALINPSSGGSQTVNVKPYSPSRKQRRKTKSVVQKRWYNLNLVDSIFLESLPRIGPVLAGRICRFREALGGFHSVDQLQEVWGIYPDQLESISAWFYVHLGDVKWVCVNTASWHMMMRHPYIRGEGARLIERFRKHHPLVDLSDLRGAILVNDSLFRKWEPYLRICDEKR
ncbi:MAG: ComEA family DNA-binding protein [Flavobacteriales bacterium]